MYILKFLNGGSEENDLEKDQFISLMNILCQNDCPKKIEIIFFEKNRIILSNSKKVDYEKFMNVFLEKEIEFFDFMRLIFSNKK